MSFLSNIKMSVHCSVIRLQSSQVSRSKCAHLCKRVHAHTPFSMHVGCACHAREPLSEWIINGCNVMTDDSERPIPPRPLTRLCRLGFHGQRETEAHAVWLINSVKHTFAVPAQCPVRALPQSLTITISMTAKSENISVSPEREPRLQSAISFHSFYIFLQSDRPTCHVSFVVWKLSYYKASHHQPKFVYSNYKGSSVNFKINILNQILFWHILMLVQGND